MAWQSVLAAVGNMARWLHFNLRLRHFMFRVVVRCGGLPFMMYRFASAGVGRAGVVDYSVGLADGMVLISGPGHPPVST